MKNLIISGNNTFNFDLGSALNMWKFISKFKIMYIYKYLILNSVRDKYIICKNSKFPTINLDYECSQQLVD